MFLAWRGSFWYDMKWRITIRQATPMPVPPSIDAWSLMSFSALSKQPLEYAAVALHLGLWKHASSNTHSLSCHASTFLQMRTNVEIKHSATFLQQLLRKPCILNKRSCLRGTIQNSNDTFLALHTRKSQRTQCLIWVLRFLAVTVPSALRRRSQCLQEQLSCPLCNP